MKQNTLAMAVLVGFIVFLWYFSSVLSDLNAWNAWDQPAEVAKMLKAGVFGLIAFASAIGMDVRKFLAGIGINFGAPEPASAPPATMGDPRGAARVMVMAAALLVALCGMWLASCATLPHKADGTLDVVELLVWTQDGLNAGCADEWLSPTLCTFGTDAVSTAQAVAAHNPDTIRAAVKQSLIDSEARLPADSRVRPYLDWLIQLL